MNPERYATVKELFNRAADLDTDARTEFLRTSCEDSGIRREVEQMLTFADDADDDDSFERGALGLIDKVPAAIGDYRIVREIGRGGMGVVYEAVREKRDFVQRVALKVIKRGMDTDAILRRFRVEQKILASLEHPGIARFLDGGMTSDGLAFYAMEFIDGEPINEYCRRRKLDARAIAALFREVCAAVQYAHQNLVIHRDLKPRNIFVTPDGQPKLLDFGISKLLTPDAEEDSGTATKLGMMTPAYASPEQIRGERIGTTSDVYSLGVILFELLTGRGPYEFGTRTRQSIERVVLADEPMRMTTAVRRREPEMEAELPSAKSLRGDLENILLKALSKEIDERYVSVGQFSEDLRRYLDGVPVIARPLTFRYRAQKFIGRNRVGVATAALVFLTLVGGIAATGWQAHRAEQQRQLAERRFAEVRTIANNVVFKYHDEIAKLDGSTAVREMLVRDATAYLDNLAADVGNDPLLERELALAYLKLGDVQGKMYSANTGETNAALESYRKSVNLLEDVVAVRPSDIAVKDDLIRANDAMVFLMARTRTTPEEKRARLDRSAAILQEIIALEPRNPTRLTQLSQLHLRYGDSVGGIAVRNSLVEKLGHHQTALRYADEAFALDPDSPEVIRAVMRASQRVGTDYLWLGENAEKYAKEFDPKADFTAALPFHRRMYELTEKLFTSLPNDAAVRRSLFAASLSYAETLARNGFFDQARELARRGLETALGEERRDATNKEAPLDVGEAYAVLARIDELDGNRAEQLANLERAIQFYELVYRGNPGNHEAEGRLVDVLRSSEKVLGNLGRTAQAQQVQRRIDEIKRQNPSR